MKSGKRVDRVQGLCVVSLAEKNICKCSKAEESVGFEKLET